MWATAEGNRRPGHPEDEEGWGIQPVFCLGLCWQKLQSHIPGYTWQRQVLGERRTTSCRRSGLRSSKEPEDEPGPCNPARREGSGEILSMCVNTYKKDIQKMDPGSTILWFCDILFHIIKWKVCVDFFWGGESQKNRIHNMTPDWNPSRILCEAQTFRSTSLILCRLTVLTSPMQCKTVYQKLHTQNHP